MARFLDLKQKNGRRQNLVKSFLKITRFILENKNEDPRKDHIIEDLREDPRGGHFNRVLKDDLLTEDLEGDLRK